MLKDIKKVNKKVKAILSTCPETRNSDKQVAKAREEAEKSCHEYYMGVR